MSENTAHQFTTEDYLAIVVRRRWWIIVSVFLGWSIALTSTFFIPKKYLSETLILVEQQKVPQHYVVPNIDVDVQERLQNMIQQILSRTRLLGIIQDLKLYRDDAQRDPDVLIQRMRGDIKIDLIRGRARGDELSAFKVTYSAPSATLAQQVTNSLTSLFIEENIRNRQKQSEDTTAFLENQLESAREDLNQQEARLRDFKSQHLGQLPQQLESNVQILSGIQERLRSATAILNQAYQQKAYLESLLSQYPRPDGANPASGSSVAAQQLRSMRNELTELRSRYTERHPDIVRLQAKIAATEEEISQNYAEASQAPASTPAGTSSPRGQIESQLKANGLEIENRKAEVKQLEREIDSYQGRLNLTPVIEQQLSAITRDHEQSRTNYESLLAKKMQSQLATNLEKQQQGEQFRVIDPPSLPLKPFWPNRLKFSLGGIGGGMGLAFLAIALLEVVDPRLFSERHIDPSLRLLVEIPTIVSAFQRQIAHRRLVIEIATASLILLTIPAVTLLVYVRG